MTRHTPLQKRSIIQRNTILTAARGLLIGSPLSLLTVTTADIAGAADVSIGTIYRYFTDRVDIILTLYPNVTFEFGEMSGSAFMEVP